MSFLKKIKNKFTSPNASVTLQLSKNSFALGENIEGTLKATSNEDFDCTEMRLEFQCVEKKKRIVPQYDATAKREVLREVRYCNPMVCQADSKWPVALLPGILTKLSSKSKHTGWRKTHLPQR